MYTITFKPSALKELANINNKDAKKIFQKILGLENEPRPVNCKKACR
jgi:mRNA-degrading endonuclease RelE of RelBE toxin-antitoxin system